VPVTACGNASSDRKWKGVCENVCIVLVAASSDSKWQGVSDNECAVFIAASSDSKWQDA
jgi:hypothetical protein